MSTHNLIAHFARAGLPLQLAGAPLTGRGAGVQDIVQLDIARPDRRARFERFRLWTGAPSNRIEVQGADKHLRQLVLMIHEPRRAFETAQWKSAPLPPNATVVRRDKTHVWLRHFTDERKRHFLAGMDEAHLFVAQLPRPVSTVWGAHVALKGPEVRSAERGAFERTIRQGEWFFVSVPPRELADVEAARARSLAPLRRNVGIAQAAGLNRAGRPHIADEALVLSGRIYVRGAIRHPDHATLTLLHWRRALGNTEAFSQPAGVLWVD